MNADHDPPAACKACGCAELTDEGQLPEFSQQLFGGGSTNALIHSGILWHCRACDLRFRHPYVDERLLLNLYQALPSSVWESNEERAVWKDILRIGSAHGSAKTILDIGCFTGNFLRWMPPEWEKLGIEPSAAAREIARSRGIHIVGESIGAAPQLAADPSVVTMIDVIEHVERPMEALRFARDLLGERGVLIIFTGNANSRGWRTFGTSYWYSSLPEHVSFFTRRFFEYAAGELNMKIVEYRRMSSVSPKLSRSIFNCTRLSLYALVRGLRQRGWSENTLAALPVIRRVARWNTTPWWQEARDHQLIALAR